ncbi:MAG: paraquat-inducible protein B [Desulfuromonas sp.]|nr:MAG: paraquat-inducible protein B [Desulfuromonas sp.]
MPEKKPDAVPTDSTIPVAEIRSARRFSITWLVPLIALLIAGWLIYTTVSSQGPTITIRFLNAEGLERETTKIKYKEVEIGTVKDIDIATDLDGVVVTAELKKGTEKYLTDQTRFWIAKAHVSVREVRDLGTLLSGAYIGIDPVLDGPPQNDFIGLERPPAVSNSRPGRFFVLSTESLGSLSIGSPILYRQIEVGQVTDYHLKNDNSGVLIDIFIEAPFHDLVRENSHFWNASGVRVNIDTSGVEIQADSLITLFLGGIAFDSPRQDLMDPAVAGETFQLMPDRDTTTDDAYTVKLYFTAYFDDPVHGLNPGAPVEFKGIHIGEVEKIVPEFDSGLGDFRIKTILVIKPQKMLAGFTAEQEFNAALPKLVARGLRAQLSTDNYLTGQLYVDLDFHQDVPAAEIISGEPYPQLPTVSSSINQTTASIGRILKKLEQIPMDQIGTELARTFDNLNQTLFTVKNTLDSANQNLGPALTDTLEQFRQTSLTLQKDFDGDSVLQYRLQELLQELQMTSRSLRTLAEYLERNPQSIIFGKEEEQP